jgi:hypothetical protein
MKAMPLSVIEPLESRIAPAVIFAGNPNSDDTEYADAPFVSTLAPGDQISDVVGHDATVFFLRLNTGDVLKKYDNGYTNFISGPNGTPLKGTVVAFFVDRAHGATPANGEMDADELTGLSLGKGVSVEVSGTVDGDVVANYNEVTKTLGGAAEAGGSTATDLLLNSITSFAAGAVKGKIISGGDIKSIKVTNDVGSILTGRAADGVTYDFNSTVADGGDTLAVPNVAGAKGVNISNVSVGSLTLLEAGGGGAGGIGGNVSGVTVISDTDGFTIKAGSGGDGIAGKPGGGKGGMVSKIVVNGLDENETDPSANSLVTIAAGKGGVGLGAGKGGIGGDVIDLSIGYELKSGKLEPSINALADKVSVQAGFGGAGASGGNGGMLQKIQILASPTGAGNDIDILAGNGGASLVAGGAGGAGGAVLTVDARNPSASALAKASFINVHSGDGGVTAGGVGKGNNGGLINGLTLVGFSEKIASGIGSDGSTGAGYGGDIKKVLISDGFLGVRANNVIIDAGSGGSASVGKGNKGGAIDSVTVLNADLATFTINQTGTAGDGGVGAKGGGNGGGVANLNINDVAGPNSVFMHLRTGKGGDGAAGGLAGSFTGTNVIFGVNARVDVTASAGGTANNNGKGGGGGNVTNLTVVTEDLVGAVASDAIVHAGAGGAGNGKGAGGAGGYQKTISLQALGTVEALAGAGGAAGAGSAPGVGGAINSIFGMSGISSLNVAAGNAGAGGVKGAVGGAFMLAFLLAATTITLTGGNGSAGGAGGGIKDASFTDSTGTGASAQQVTVTGGAGSGLGKLAGAGGSLTSLFGFIGQTGVSQIVAGIGGAGASAAAAGGSVSDVNILGGGGGGAEFRIEAGDAQAAATTKGGAGGKVTGISVDDLAAGTIFRRIAAGAGGDSTVAKGIGGQGGSVTDVRVDYDIGVRSGQAFGYDTMGGIFAGQAGLSGAGGKAALAGSVIDISANAIASIVAGKPVIGSIITARNLTQVVDSIYLNNNIATVVDGNGTYTNFATANVLGGVVNPTLVGNAYPAAHSHANTFDLANGEFIDTDPGGVAGEFSLGDTTTAATDGFVAAVFFNPANSNVMPEAIFRTDPTDGVIKFFDLNNTNGQHVVL